MSNERLIEEVEDILGYGSMDRSVIKAVIKKVKALTLKEVGDYLDKGWLDEREGYKLVHTTFIESLKQGKLSEG